PTGILLNRARKLIDAVVPPPTDEQFRAFIQAGLEQMATDGFVAVHEAGASTRHMQALEALEADGALPVRVYAMLSARDGELCRRWLERGPDETDDGMLTTRSVKAYYDGALGSRGARLLDDYADRPGHRGVAGEGYGFDDALVAEMMRAGFQVGIHAIGDAGNRETLDFIERVVAEAPDVRSGRHRIEHAQVVHPDDFPRFGELALIASMEPPHAVEDMAWAEDRLGPERVRGAYAWRTLRLHGAGLIFNSDLTGSDHRIGYGLHAAVTRRNKQLEPTGGWYPDERVTAEEAVRAYTVWPAYAAGWEYETGVLAPGRWADVTVVDLDPLVVGSTEPARLLETRVLLTVVGGRVVFESETAGSSD
ncbi:MAG: amidohydrolase family protein, partial [Actinobacteria bacterium]|nr:amidohydrolase family protein [Actinomycetota bacterium]